jgi:prepilin signal peptidase PulO-like enzyme (type II secretory pathway)
MVLYPDLLLLAFCGGGLALSARQLIGQAREFLLENDGPDLTRLQSMIITIPFMCTGMMLTLSALNQQITWSDAGRYIVLLAWGIPMVLLDMRNCWLPFCYTTGFWLSGLLFTFLPASPLTLTQALISSGVMFILLYTFHDIAWRLRGEEGLGLGDVHLIAALCAWFPWQQVCILSGWAFLLLVITALLTRKRAQPYAPWLFALLTILAGNFSLPTLTGAL